MNNNKEHNEELNQPDFLAGIPGIDPKKLRSNPMKAPEGYFEDLTPRMMQAVKDAQVKEENTSWLEGIFPKVVAPTLGIAMIIIVAFFALRNNAGPDLDTQFAELANDISLEQLVLLDEFKSVDLIETDLLDLESGMIEDDEDITEYLLENEVELSTLVDEITL